MRLSQVFAALADLAPARRETAQVIPASTRMCYVRGWDVTLPRDSDIDRLAAVDALHRDQRTLRRAWGIVYFLQEDGRRAQLPMVTQPVRLARTLRGYTMEPAGDLEVTNHIGDPAVAARLEAELPPTLDGESEQCRIWLEQATEAAGFDGVPIELDLRRTTDTIVVAATALFSMQTATVPVIADHLRGWAQRPGLETSTLAAIYDDVEPPAEEPDRDTEPVTSPLPLDPDQHAAVIRARRDVVSVVSGAPGCGKSHTLAAIAVDAVARGQSVLMATQTVHASEVLGELLARQPGPSPVRFGDAEKREQLITELTSGSVAGRHRDEVRAAERDASLANRTARAIEGEIVAQLELEAAASRAASADPVVLNDAPGLLDPDCDPEEVQRLLRSAREDGGWLVRWRARRAERQLRTIARSDLPLDDLELLAPVAADLRGAGRLAALGGTDLDGHWERLGRAEEAARRASGEALSKAVTAGERRDRSALRAMSALGTALRAGRNRRRQLLAGIDPEALLRALPLWIGTVTDVEDLLPQQAGMFDLVILDEASHIDQIRAAPVLVRARRAVVAGDPKQLRFVSFVADRDVDEVTRRHGLDAVADRLDLRRNSAFDLAAGAAPVTMLHEHYRSVPHLIGFSADRFYAGRISTATRHPRNHGVDAIDVHRADGAEAGKAEDGVSEAELRTTVDLVAKLLTDGVRDLAVITPFRAQAERIESELLATYSADEIIDFRLRAGTVHSFQGSEAATVVASLGVHRDDSASRLRFASDPHLFNVLLTRARAALHVVTALDQDEGLIDDFLDYAEHPPAPPKPASVDAWAEAVAAELAAAGATVSTGYPVGRWIVDLCLGTGTDAVGVICGVHPAGPQAHVDRQRVLHQVGWRTRDAFASRYENNPVRAALALLTA